MLSKEKKVIFRLRGVPGVAHTLIERGRVSAAGPRVRKDDLLRCVRNGRWEFATLEERNVKTQVEHVLKTVVDVNTTIFEKFRRGSVPGRGKETKGWILQEIVGPFERIRMELVGVS